MTAFMSCRSKRGTTNTQSATKKMIFFVYRHRGADLPTYDGHGSILLGPFRTRFEKAEALNKTTSMETGTA
jgi:hypothetical protein